jgi:hypothetical protein
MEALTDYRKFKGKRLTGEIGGVILRTSVVIERLTSQAIRCKLLLAEEKASVADFGLPSISTTVGRLDPGVDG